jgi:polyhydroxyalkanoate synthesis repressor PhaR
LRILKKYPNRRLYDTETSAYVTLEDVRKMILKKEPVKVVDSKTGQDLTRSVLLQIISEQEAEGHEPLLTNKVLEQVVRFYGDSMQGVLSRYLEQSIFTFLEQQELYQRRMREVLNTNPLKLMQRLADQNMAFLRSLMPGAPLATGGRDGRSERMEAPPADAPDAANGGDLDTEREEPPPAPV